MKKLTVKELYDLKCKDFAFSLESNMDTLNKMITNQNVNRPQFALFGYFERFPYERIQLLGETEIVYINSLSEDALYKCLSEVMLNNIPCFIVSKGLTVPNQMKFLANEMNIAILRSRLSTEKLYWELSRFLREYFTQSLTMHATLVEVNGVGILLTGKSGIGKSECALELIERGHIFICDDITRVILDDTTLVGMPQKEDESFMEVRGVGIIDVERMFGIQSVKKKTFINIQVELVLWNENMDYERIGIDGKTTEMLGVNIPLVNIPVSPGKNVAVIIEVIAMNQILKSYGYDASKIKQQKLSDEIKNKTREKR